MIDESDIKMMELAISEAEKAGQRDEVPIGSIIVGKGQEVLSRGHNLTISMNDPTAHAEILAIRQAAEITGNYRLSDMTLYVTIEPCIMCMGAIVQSRIGRVVFGAKDPKWGACGSLYDLSCDNRLNHMCLVTSGVLENRCREIIQDFFRAKREIKKHIKLHPKE